MTYAHTIIFNIIDVILLLVMVLLSLKAMNSNVVQELCDTFTVVGSILAASCFHKPFAKFVYTHITKNVSITFLNSIGLIIIFIIFFLIGRLITNFITGLISEVPKGKNHMIASVFLAFIRVYFILAVVIYIFHTKTKILQEAKIRYSRGVVYKTLKNTGRDILNISTQPNLYYY